MISRSPVLPALLLTALGASLVGCDVEDLLAWRLRPGDDFDAAQAPPAPSWSGAFPSHRSFRMA